MTALPIKHSSGCYMAAENRSTTEHLEDKSGDGDVDSRLQVQLEEDGGGSTEQS